MFIFDAGNSRDAAHRTYEVHPKWLLFNKVSLSAYTSFTSSFNSIMALRRQWFHQREIKTQNVAGPRESKRPGIYSLTRELLVAVDTSKWGQRGPNVFTT